MKLKVEDRVRDASWTEIVVCIEGEPPYAPLGYGYDHHWRRKGGPGDGRRVEAAQEVMQLLRLRDWTPTLEALRDKRNCHERLSKSIIAEDILTDMAARAKGAQGEVLRTVELDVELGPDAARTLYNGVAMWEEA